MVKKSIIISSDGSSKGKTTFTLGLMKALKDRNLEVQGYKSGPDYIDIKFHEHVTGRMSINLDSYLTSKEGVIQSFLDGEGDVGVIEGAMGLYDGISISAKASTYEVSKILNDMPIILILSPKGQSLTICALINGLISFKNANICGVVLNMVSYRYYLILKEAIEKNCNVKVFGYIKKDEDIMLSSRYLGLVQSDEVSDIDEKVEKISLSIRETVDIDDILNSMKSFKREKKMLNIKKRDIKIAVAYDKAFQFYYAENIKILEKFGNVVFFSPLESKHLPENCDSLYLGGGYPELFKEELSQNTSLLEDINKKLNNGLRCYAECGGLMYLMKSIEGYKMVNFFDGECFMTKSLVNFGYCKVSINEKCFKEKFFLNAHEFHRSIIKSSMENVYTVQKKDYDGTIKEWKCGYHKKNTLGGYAHISFLSNIKFLESLLFL
ncbi:cobyrinate a,c-diamide synthase [Clostridium sp. BJN0001]|uniref:cobyrinate a,c-diamide synthase n=1 Tax=Clostridium sp. BJN0001 TaxID=2930219 RepID=UPI001FD3AF68|nr:cobyrinate a,c-diamide synthase [Clostridium sp. BJN0001]